MTRHHFLIFPISGPLPSPTKKNFDVSCNVLWRRTFAPDFMTFNQSWSSRASAVRGPCPCFLSPLQRFQCHLHRKRQMQCLRRVAVHCSDWKALSIRKCLTILHFSSDRQLVQLFHVIRERRQYLSQLRPFRDESLDQTRPRPDELRSQAGDHGRPFCCTASL